MKWNKTQKGINKTVNFEGGEAYKLDDRTKLLQLVSTCLVNEPKFYGETGDTLKEIKHLAEKISDKFILQLAEYTRTELYLRSVSQYLLVLAANINETKQYVREYTPRIIQRADGINEVMSCQLETFGKPIPNCLKKGLADTFPKFNEYHYGKYNRTGKSVTFKDVIMLTHPKEPSDIIGKILNDDLETPETWEVEISKNGNRAEVWESLIDNNKLPYFASLRNLRNLLQANISDEHLTKTLDYISNEEAVRRSKILPFRYYSAYLSTVDLGFDRERWVIKALEDAAKVSFDNIPHLDGTTMIACDTSGSMTFGISNHSQIRHIDIGLLLGSALDKFVDRGYFSVFGEDMEVVNITGTDILSSTVKARRMSGRVGHSTNGWKVIRWLRDEKKYVDRIMVFTDCQLWDSTTGFVPSSNTIREEFNKYKEEINSDAKIYLFDLNGYGTVSFPQNDNSSVMIAGWNSNIFDFIQINESGYNTQVEYIEKKY